MSNPPSIPQSDSSNDSGSPSKVEWDEFCMDCMELSPFKRHRSATEIDMTPMVDVVFLLLIFFMITTAFGLQKSIEIPSPESDQSSTQSQMPEEKEDENIVVRISKEDRIYVEGEDAATQQELYAKLREHQHRNSGVRGRHLLILADSEATHEHVIRVLDAAAGVGMDSVRLKTE